MHYRQEGTEMLVEDEVYLDTIVAAKPNSRRRRRRKRQTTMRQRSFDTIKVALSLILMITLKERGSHVSRTEHCASFGVVALIPRTKLGGQHPGRTRNTSSLSWSLLPFPSDPTSSPLFSKRIKNNASPTPTKDETRIRTQSRQGRWQNRRHRNSISLFSSRSMSSISSPTALHMVLTTPESIIEQASTVNLLDDLINESVRTSARRPIMMQFDPSSGWIWRRWKGTVFAETWISCGKSWNGMSSIASIFDSVSI